MPCQPATAIVVASYAEAEALSRELRITDETGSRPNPDFYVIAVCHALTGRRFTTILVTERARWEMKQHSVRGEQARLWYREALVTRLDVGGKIVNV